LIIVLPGLALDVACNVIHCESLISACQVLQRKSRLETVLLCISIARGEIFYEVCA